MNKRTLLWITCALTFISVLYYHYYFPSERTWEAVLPDLPSNVLLENGDMDGTYYVLKQTHEPLFRIDDGQNYQSKVLSYWEKSIDSKTYFFVPNTALKFNQNESFSLDYFKDYLIKITKKYYNHFYVNKRDNGIQITFPIPRRGYLDFLCEYKNSPSIRYSNNIDQGLGPYMVTKITKEQLELRRKKPIHDGYNILVFHQYRGLKAPNLQNSNIADFNHLLHGIQPEWLNKDYTSFTNPLLASGNLL